MADDQDLMAAGTAAALDSLGEFELVGVAASAAEAGELAAATQPDSASSDTRVLAYSGELQLHELRRLGVRYGQGYHLGRPEPLPAAA